MPSYKYETNNLDEKNDRLKKSMCLNVAIIMHVKG